MTTGPGRLSADLLTDLLRNPLDPAYEAAARRRAARGPEPAWLHTTSRAIRLATVGVIGLLLAIAYQHVVAAEPTSNRTRDELVAEVRTRQQTTDELSRHAERLRDEVDRQRQAALDGDEVNRLRNLAAAAGLGRVRGAGVVIELRDAPNAVDPVTGQSGGENLGRVFDRDLQAIANALWDAGAEAIAINDQRLSSTSTIRAAGAAILVDFKPVTSPYRVTAIGPDDLARRFERSPTAELFRQWVRRYKMSMQIREQANLTLPAATDPQLHNARPAGQASSSPSASGGS